MSKKDEALKLALEALEQSHPEAYRHTITAIREALAEQPAQQDQGMCGYDETTGNCTNSPCCYTSPPASKPWMGLTESEIEKLAVEAGKATFLNDDEQTDILWFDGDCFGLARAIEAKLREKNAS